MRLSYCCLTRRVTRRDHPPVESAAGNAVGFVLLAPNPSAMTLEGTNTWLLRGADAGENDGYIVIDAGPSDEGHLAAVAALGTIDLILLTHGHLDHSGGSARLAELTGAPVLALDEKFGEPLRAGDTLRQSGLTLEIIGTRATHRIRFPSTCRTTTRS